MKKALTLTLKIFLLVIFILGIILGIFYLSKLENKRIVLSAIILISVLLVLISPLYWWLQTARAPRMVRPGQIDIDYDRVLGLYELKIFIQEFYNLEEIWELCFLANIDYENFPGTKSLMVNSLVNYMYRHNRLNELISAMLEIENSKKVDEITHRHQRVRNWLMSSNYPHF